MQMDSIPESNDNPYKQSTGLIHFAFEMETEKDVDTLTAQLVADGFEVLDGPRKTGDGYYESAGLDPERNRIEITA